MRGEVVKLDTASERGLILGADGNRYEYSASQIRNHVELMLGHTVDFVAMGNVARDIYLVNAAAFSATPQPQPQPQPKPQGVPAPASAPPGAVYTPVQPYNSGPPAESQMVYSNPPHVPAEGLWTYFIRGLTKNYAQFQGRARRSEYWGYTLFWWVFVVGFLIIDIIIIGILSAIVGSPVPLPLFTIVWQLGTFIPNIAVVVRRIHDVGLSGWLYCLKFLDPVLPIGSLVIFVITLMDSQDQTNAHGPNPKWAIDTQVAGVFD